jgi:hypothetical protein
MRGAHCRQYRALTCSVWVRCPAFRLERSICVRSMLSRRGRRCPVMPTECSVRRARAAVADQHCRRNARGASAASAWRVRPTTCCGISSRGLSTIRTRGRLARPRGNLHLRAWRNLPPCCDPPRVVARQSDGQSRIRTAATNTTKKAHVARIALRPFGIRPSLAVRPAMTA